MKPVSRRRFLSSALGTTAGVSMCRSVFSPALGHEAQMPIEATALTEDLVLLSGAGANVVALKASDGALLVDGGLEKRSGDLIGAALKATSARRVSTLFNTHWHPEQTGSNAKLGGGGVRIIAHENTKLWLTRKIAVDWRAGSYGPFDKKALPNQTFYKTGSLAVGSETVDYGYMAQAHTDGDIYVFFRKANVLHAGGVLSCDRWPILDYQTGGWIAGLVAGLDKLLELADEKTKIVPANGPVILKADLQAQRTMYFTIYDRLVKSLTKGLGPTEALAQQPAKEFHPEWGSSDAFVDMAFKSLWGHYAPDA